MEEQTELLREILQVLRLIAEPQLARRDEAQRALLIEIVGKGVAKARAASLMNGTRTQSAIAKEAAIDPGALSRMTKSLRKAKLLRGEDKTPNLAISLPEEFWVNLVKQSG